jgi:hypothetical protein
VKLVALACVLVACTPRNEPKGPGTLPEPVEGTAATSEPSRPAPAPRPMVMPQGAAPVPVTAPPPEEVAPLQAKIVFVPAKGSAVKGELALVQTSDDDTRVFGTLTGLAKNTAYSFGKRDDCAAHKADDDSRRSKTLVYVLAIKANADGVATIEDTSKAIHLDGPLSLMGAIFVVGKTAASKELACGRVVIP